MTLPKDLGSEASLRKEDIMLNQLKKDLQCGLWV